MARRLKILLIEDRQTDAELCLEELRRAGFMFESQRVYTRERLEHALDSFAPDLVLADFSIPSDIHGVVGLQTVRQFAPHVPFIYVSGTVGEERAREAMKNGATDYVPKDRLHELGPAVERALRKS